MTRLAAFIVLFAYATWLPAVEVQQGQLYAPGTLIESSEVGAAFTIPPGWQGAWPPGSQFFILESQALKASLFMLFDQSNEQQLRHQMSQAIPLDATVTFSPVSGPKKTSGGALTAQYRVAGQPSLAGFVAAREFRAGFSVAVIALSQQSTSQQVNTLTEQLVRSIESRKVAAQSRPSTQGGQPWQEYMRGRYIARYYSGSSYGEKEELWLCSDGTFYHSFGSGGFSMNGASGAGQSQGQGRWKAEGSTGRQGTLILQFGAGAEFRGSAPGFEWGESGPGGERWNYQLALADKLYLNGDQWLRGDNEYCR